LIPERSGDGLRPFAPPVTELPATGHAEQIDSKTQPTTGTADNRHTSKQQPDCTNMVLLPQHMH